MNYFSYSIVVILLVASVCSYAQTTDSKISSLEGKLEQLKKQETDIQGQLEGLRLNRIQERLKEPGYPVSPAACELVEHSAMSLCYDEEHEQPRWVMHMVTPDVIYGNLNRTNDFREDPKVTSGSAEKADYWFSGYDRGHLAPSADFRWSSKAISESYYYSNMSPQKPDLNREQWAELEWLTRSYVIATQEPIYLITGGILKEGLPTIGENKVSIPEWYYKIALDIDGDEKRAIAFLMPNGICDYPVNYYATSIDSIEALTGIDFFPNLDKALQDELEAQKDAAAWTMENEDVVKDVAPLKPPLPKGYFNTIQARLYMGETACVCGTVVATKLSAKSGATFLNLDKKFPNQVFSATIWETHRTNFSYLPEEFLLGKKVCITGKISEYKGLPTMSISHEKRIEIIDDDAEF